MGQGDFDNLLERVHLLLHGAAQTGARKAYRVADVDRALCPPCQQLGQPGRELERRLHGAKRGGQGLSWVVSLSGGQSRLAM